MKVLLVLFAACVVLCAAADKPAFEKYEEVKTKCKEEAGATDEDLKEMKEKDELTSPRAQKMMACVFMKNKIIQNDKFSKEGSLEQAKEILKGQPDSEAKLKIVEQVTDACAKEIGEPKASAEEMAKLIFNCFKKQGKAKGLPTLVAA